MRFADATDAQNAPKGDDLLQMLESLDQDDRLAILTIVRSLAGSPGSESASRPPRGPQR